MRKIASTILCSVIAMVLLFFGLRIDEADTLFYTQNAGAESVVAVVCSGGATISEVKSPDTQIMSTRNDAAVQQFVNQSATGKKELKNLVFLLLVDNLSDNNSYSEKAVCVTEPTDIRHRVAVLNYIHDLDGKKRV